MNSYIVFFYLDVSRKLINAKLLKLVCLVTQIFKLNEKIDIYKKSNFHVVHGSHLYPIPNATCMN